MTSGVTTAARRTGIVVLLVLATLFWAIGGFAIWANRQMLNTDNWVSTSDQLLRNETIRTALSSALLDRLYQSAPVETAVRDQLPENLKPLAAPLAAAAHRVADDRAPQILGTPAALTAWEKTNETAHKVFLKLVNGDLASGGEVNLDVKNLLTQVASGVGLPTSVVQKLPPQYQQITVLKSDQLKSAQDGVSLLKSLPWILLPLAAILFAAAIWLAADRRRGIVWVAGCMIFAGVLVLAARRLGTDYVVNAIADAPNIRPAAKATLAIGTSLLTDVAWGSIVLGVIIGLGAWLSGPGKRATALRSVSAPAMRDHAPATRVALGFLILLLLIWGPVPWTRNIIWMLVLTVIAFIWLEWVRRRTLEEFPDVQAGELSRRVRAVLPGRRASAASSEDDSLTRLERLADLRARGVLDEDEYQREKAALVPPTQPAPSP
jgi:Short C-terminal domain